MLTPTLDPEPMPKPTTEPEHVAISISETEVAAQSDQVCEPTSTHEPVGCLEELKDDGSLPLLILPNLKPSSPLILSSSKTSSLWIIHPPCLPLSPHLPRLVGPSARLCWCPSVPQLHHWIYQFKLYLPQRFWAQALPFP